MKSASVPIAKRLIMTNAGLRIGDVLHTDVLQRLIRRRIQQDLCRLNKVANPAWWHVRHAARYIQRQILYAERVVNCLEIICLGTRLGRI